MTKEIFDGYKYIEGGVCAAKGFVANGLNCGINPVKEKFDLGVVYSETECNAAGVYTQNKVKGAPIIVTKKHLENGACYAYRKFPTWKPVVNTAVISRLNLKTSILSIHLSEIQPFSPFSGWIG